MVRVGGEALAVLKGWGRLGRAGIGWGRDEKAMNGGQAD